MDSNSQFSHIFLFLSAVFLFFLFGFWSDAKAAVFFSLPSNGTVTTGDTFFLEIRLDTEGEEVNAVEAIIEFPNEMFEALDATNGGSFLALWPRPPFFSNDNGRVEFAGGTPSGFNGKDGLIGKILFKALRPRERAVISFQNGRALLNDGKGTPAPVSSLESSFVVRESGPMIPGLSSSSHPDQLRWYTKRTFVLHWDKEENAGYSYFLSHDGFALLDGTPDTPIEDIKYDNLEDGIYYFSICRLSETSGLCESVFRWRAMIDATPPTEFEARFSKGTKELRGVSFLSFSTDDATSGIDRYELCSQECRRVTSPVVLTDEDLKNEMLMIKAYDKADNARDARIPLPAQFRWQATLAVGGMAAVILVFLKLVMGARVQGFIRTLFKGT